MGENKSDAAEQYNALIKYKKAIENNDVDTLKTLEQNDPNHQTITKRDKLVALANSNSSAVIEHMINTHLKSAKNSELQAVKDCFKEKKNFNAFSKETIIKLLTLGIIDKFRIFETYEKSATPSPRLKEFIAFSISMLHKTKLADYPAILEKNDFNRSHLIPLLNKNDEALTKKIREVYDEDELSDLLYLWMGGNGLMGRPDDVATLMTLYPDVNDNEKANPFFKTLKKITSDSVFMSESVLKNVRLMHQERPQSTESFFIDKINAFKLENNDITNLLALIDTEKTAMEALKRITKVGSVEQLEALISHLNNDSRSTIKDTIKIFSKNNLTLAIKKHPEKLPLLFQKSEIVHETHIANLLNTAYTANKIDSILFLVQQLTINDAFASAMHNNQPLLVFKSICSNENKKPTQYDINTVLNEAARQGKKEIFDFIRTQKPTLAAEYSAFKTLFIGHPDTPKDILDYNQILKAMEDSIVMLSTSNLFFRMDDKRKKMEEIKRTFNSVYSTNPAEKTELLQCIKEFYFASHQTRGLLNFSTKKRDIFDSRSGICFDEKAGSAILSLLGNSQYDKDIMKMKSTLEEKYKDIPCANEFSVF